MNDLKNHLDSDEQMLLTFKPSRKAYLAHYILATIIFVVSLILFFLPLFRKELMLVSLTLAIIFLVSALIIAGRIEYIILATRYALTNERMLYSVGVFTESFESARYPYVTDVSVYQTLGDKIMNTGVVKINTAGSDEFEINYSSIPDPFMVMRIINDHIPQQPPVGVRPDILAKTTARRAPAKARTIKRKK